MSELPKGWIVVTLGEVCSKPQYGYTTKSCPEGRVQYLRTTDLSSGKVNWGTVPYCLTEPDKVDKYQLEHNDIVISRAGSVGYHHLIKSPPNNAVFASYLIRFKPLDCVEPRYLSHFLNSRQYWSQITEHSAGVAVQNVNAKKLASLVLPVAPLDEQKRIADKLDSVLAKVEAAQARLDKIPTILKRFRQSVLAAATSGELTKEWREIQHNHSSVQQLIERIAEERKALKTKKLLKKSFGNSDMVTPIIDDTPVNWVWCSFDDIAANKNNALKAGPFGSALKKQDCVSSGYKVYGQEQVISGNENLDTYFVDEEKFNELISCEVQPGDILISLVGTIGKVLVLSEKAEQGIINPRLVKLSLNPAINTEFIKLYLSSPYAMAFFRSFSHGGTMEILNLKILRKLPLCLPPIEEQSEIVNRVTELFEHAKAVESQYVHASLGLKKLSQSILSKAFKGEILSSSVDSSIEAIESSIEALNA